MKFIILYILITSQIVLSATVSNYYVAIIKTNDGFALGEQEYPGGVSTDGLFDTNILWISYSSKGESELGTSVNPYRTFNKAALENAADKVVIVIDGVYFINEPIFITNKPISIQTFGVVVIIATSQVFYSTSPDLLSLNNLNFVITAPANDSAFIGTDAVIISSKLSNCSFINCTNLESDIDGVFLYGCDIDSCVFDNVNSSTVFKDCNILESTIKNINSDASSLGIIICNSCNIRNCLFENIKYYLSLLYSDTAGSYSVLFSSFYNNVTQSGISYTGPFIKDFGIIYKCNFYNCGGDNIGGAVQDGLINALPINSVVVKDNIFGLCTNRVDGAILNITSYTNSAGTVFSPNTDNCKFSYCSFINTHDVEGVGDFTRGFNLTTNNVWVRDSQ